MKLKKVLALTMAATLAFSLVGCGEKDNDAAADNTGDVVDTDDTDDTDEVDDADETDGANDETASGDLNYADIVLGESYQDVTASIKVLNHRTDLIEDGKMQTYVDEFNKMYPNITVEYEGITDYAEDSLLRLSGGDWGDIMMIPAVDKALLGTYFIPFGDLDSLSSHLNYIKAWSYEGQVYGVPSTANAQGIIYNKKVFEEAGITELPATPEQFIDALQKVKDNTDAIPLYTNYAAGWTMGAWDAYIAGSATGDEDYMENVLVHSKDPMSDPGDGTGPYNVYKVLYDAVANGLIEDDYSTTDWEACKGMINNGEIATMVLGSWAVSQMQEAGENPDDIGYMSFPITVNGKRYASANGDYNYAININASNDNQIASMVYIKWLTEKSDFVYSQGGVPVAVNGDYNELPEMYVTFGEANVEFVENGLAPEGEEGFRNELNAESELNFDQGGNTKIQTIVEHASKGDKTFDEIMADWNAAWTSAQEDLGIEPQ